MNLVPSLDPPRGGRGTLDPPRGGRGTVRGPRPTERTWTINILVVEDDAADTALILDILTRHPNVSTAHASNAPDVALRQLAIGALRPDLILLDIHMPRMGGFEFLEDLRKIPAMANVPVVLLTTSCLSQDVVAARGSSASSYVIKPDTYAELNARLNGVISLTIAGGWRK